MINICLHQPEMPSNTGNIGRTCLLTGSRLHLIRPYAFKLDDKSLKRAGMDYWKDIDLVIHDSYDEFRKYTKGKRVFYSTTKAHKYYNQIKFEDGDFIVFGCESSGLPEEILHSGDGECIKIPMINTTDRSLNLANSANIILFEALRQLDFPHMD